VHDSIGTAVVAAAKLPAAQAHVAIDAARSAFIDAMRLTFPIAATIILAAARWVFGVPIVGSLLVLYLVALVFVAANLTVGITLSSLAQNQLQAMQLTFFYFLPNMLLSGFMFPFRGMPHWARVVGSLLPMTYFNRLARGILLKGNRFPDLWPDLWPMLVFTAVVLIVALRFYRKTLD